ncbi:polyprenyl synthetase family protein [Helicobacter cynogastricus]|uniref:polyprenyl synthetase family protein n=1 Tax=Helicobacter cynogastricus TaxID=329937 RepID=UPI000CF1460C|nr:polyprenyl synthetase family protein [Helicobacter cynogastricus]
MSVSKVSLNFYTHVCEAFEEYLHKAKPRLDTFHPFFEKAFWEMLENGGKRFRPKLFLAVLCAYEENTEVVHACFPVALALEVLHTYSLIHDDLPCMDNADTRRYHPTLHKSYDETTATLVGDGLNTYAFVLLANAPLADGIKVALIATLAECGGIGGMVLGQAIDCYFERIQLERIQLEHLHTLKTGALIAASLKMGALVVGARAEPHLPQNLFAFGLKLGLFFQVRDDIIDHTQSPEESGKSTHLDTFKNNYVNLLGLEGAQDYLQNLKGELLGVLQAFPINLAFYLQTLLKELA